MPIAGATTQENLDALHDDLKKYEIDLAKYLQTDAGQADTDYMALAKLDINLNVLIFDLATTTLQLASDEAGAAVDAINRATDAVNKVVQKKEVIARNFAVVQSVVAFAAALVGGNVQQIVAAGRDVAAKLTPA